jgi:NTP pyrophosphatase (non-canonical NTP hydrolase)
MAGKSLAAMAEEVMAYNHQMGWEPNPDQTFGDKIALGHSEFSEALEAYRDWGVKDATAQAMDEDEHHDRMHGLCVHGELRGSCSATRLPKPEGVGSEFADVLIRLVHTCANYGIDLEAEYERKMAYNRTRPYQHGGRKM